MMLHYCAFQVRLPVNYNWWTDCNERVLLFCSHSSTDRAVTKQRFGEIFIETWYNAAMSANIKTGHRATGVCRIHHSINPDANFAPSLLTHSEDAQVSNVLTATEAPAADLLSHKTLRKLLLCLVHMAIFCHPTTMMILCLTVQQSVVK
jgi:hypothetical protein